MQKNNMITKKTGDASVIFPILTLPPELFRRLLSFLTFDEIASNARPVCRHFNRCASQVLNRGFQKVERTHSQLMVQVKSQLPRRESERRNHALARHNDILTAVETRISLLGMTYNKFIDMNLACFIPGKVLDELNLILRTVKNCLNGGEQPIRPHELLQELRDISSMAMEHFEEKIAPKLKETGPSTSTGFGGFMRREIKVEVEDFQNVFHSAILEGASVSGNSTGTGTALLPLTTATSLDSTPRGIVASYSRLVALTSEVSKLRGKNREVAGQLIVYKKEVAALKAAQKRTQKRAGDQSRMIAEQNRKLDEFARKYDTLLAEVRAELRHPPRPISPPPQLPSVRQQLETSPPQSYSQSGANRRKRMAEEAAGGIRNTSNKSRKIADDTIERVSIDTSGRNLRPRK